MTTDQRLTQLELLLAEVSRTLDLHTAALTGEAAPLDMTELRAALAEIKAGQVEIKTMQLEITQKLDAILAWRNGLGN